MALWWAHTIEPRPSCARGTAFPIGNTSVGAYSSRRSPEFFSSFTCKSGDPARRIIYLQKIVEYGIIQESESL